MAAHPGFPQLRAYASRAQERELEARRRLRELRAELRSAQVDAHRASALLDARTRRLEEALEREQALQKELTAARTALLERTALHAATRAEHKAALAARDQRLRDASVRIEDLERQRRKLHARADSLRNSRAYRFVRFTWRVRATVRRPSRLFRRA